MLVVNAWTMFASQAAMLVMADADWQTSYCSVVWSSSESVAKIQLNVNVVVVMLVTVILGSPLPGFGNVLSSVRTPLSVYRALLGVGVVESSTTTLTKYV